MPLREEHWCSQGNLYLIQSPVLGHAENESESYKRALKSSMLAVGTSMKKNRVKLLLKSEPALARRIHKLEGTWKPIYVICCGRQRSGTRWRWPPQSQGAKQQALSPQ